MTLHDKLDRLAILRADFVESQIEREKAISAAMPDEIRVALNAIDAAYDTRLSSCKEAIESL